MALIICPDCGKKFSDKAPACPECGCPTTYALQNLETSASIDSASAKQISSAEDDTILETYEILEKELAITERFDKYLKWTALISSSYIKYEEKIREIYRSAGSLDNLMEELPDLLSETMDATLEAGSGILVGWGIYHLDKNALFVKYQNSIEPEQLIKPLVEKYMSILGYQDAIVRYHDYVRDVHRHTWSGCGWV